jgi:predicted metal-dependent hydrolase
VDTAARAITRRLIVDVDGIDVEIVFKPIKRIHLTVSPPDGHVRISVPIGVELEFVIGLVHERLGWIRAHQTRLQEIVVRAKADMVTGEPHYVWGRRCELVVLEGSHRAEVRLEGTQLVLQVPMNTSPERIRGLLESWYRRELMQAIPPMIDIWHPVVGACPTAWGVRRMKTRWGSCNTTTGKIWLSLELAKKDPESLEHVIVHELAHLLERGHGPQFKQILDRAIPDWRERKRRLNASVAHPDLWEPTQ